MNKLFFVSILLILSIVAAQNQITKKKNMLCGTCTSTLTIVKDFLNQSNQDWQNLINNGCLLLPDSLRQPCRIASIMLLPETLRYLREVFKDDAKVICGRIGLCGEKQYENLLK